MCALRLRCAEVTFTARDMCGNAVSQTARIVVVDTTPPVIACHGENLEFKCDPSCPGFDQWENDARGMLHSWVSQKACNCAEDCSPVTFSNDFVMPAYSLCGTSGTVTYTATDIRGNSVHRQQHYSFPTVVAVPTQQCSVCGHRDSYGNKVCAAPSPRLAR
jgi:hypothetical protein